METTFFKPNANNVNQLVTIDKLINILSQNNASTIATIIYRKLDDNASKKTPFGRVTKQIICLNNIYKNKLQNRALNETNKQILKELEYYKPFYNYVNNSHCLALNKKDNAPLLVYSYDAITDAKESIFLTSDFKNILTENQAVGMMTASGKAKYYEQKPLSHKQTYLKSQAVFKWQAIKFSNILCLTFNKTNYIVQH